MKEVEYACLFLRLIGDALVSLTSDSLLKQKDSKLFYSEIRQILQENRDPLISLLCKAIESNNSMVMNQTQHVFHFLIQLILD